MAQATGTQKWGEPRRVVAEAELLGGETIRVVRDEHGDYFADYVSSDEEFGNRSYQRSLDVALEWFGRRVREAEAWR